MRVDGHQKILEARTQLEGKGGLGDQLRAWGATMATPKTKPETGSEMTLAKPSVLPRVRPCREPAREFPYLYPNPFRLRLPLGETVQAISGSV